MVFNLFKSAEHGGRTLHGNEMIAKVITGLQIRDRIEVLEKDRQEIVA